MPFTHRKPYGIAPSPPLEANGWGRYVSGELASLSAQVIHHHESHQETREMLHEHAKILTEVHGKIIRLETLAESDKDEDKRPDSLSWEDRKEFLKELMTAARWISGVGLVLAYLFKAIDLEKMQALGKFLGLGGAAH